MSIKATDLPNLLHIRPQQNMSDKIFERISDLIRSGELPEGYVFPNETILCEQLSIGRSTIREAYKALELSGYVTRSKRGTTVNGASSILGATPLKAMVSHSSEQDFLEFRLMLEAQTAALAAQRATSDELASLQSTLDSLVSAREKGDSESMIQLDRNFHEGIASASHNPLMITAMAAVSEAWENETKRNFFHAGSKNSDVLNQMTLQHQNILNAIHIQDPDSARKLMLEHISYVSA